LEKRGWGRFYKNKMLNFNMLCFYKILLYPPFSKGEVKGRMLSQTLGLVMRKEPFSVPLCASSALLCVTN